MPYKAKDLRRHKIPKACYRIENWPMYDAALRGRGDLTIWVTPEALAAWHPPRTGHRDPKDGADGSHGATAALLEPWPPSLER